VADVAERGCRMQTGADQRGAGFTERITQGAQRLHPLGYVAHHGGRALDERRIELMLDLSGGWFDATDETGRVVRELERVSVHEQQLLLDAQREIGLSAEGEVHRRSLRPSRSIGSP
jgi:hypothetical protein